MPRLKSLLRREKARLEKTYGTLSDSDVSKILRAERELAECEGCSGQCLKKCNRYSRPKIRRADDGVYIDLIACGHEIQCNVPYAGKTLNDYWYSNENLATFRTVGWYLTEKPKQSLFLFGETGTGKTLLASVVAQEFARVGASVVFGDVPSLLGKLKATFDKGGTQDVLAKYKNCDLLVLDDLGAGQVTDWSVGVLYEIINARYDGRTQGKRLVITSNHSLEDLEKRLVVKDKAGKIVDADTSKRIVSRLCEMCVQAFLGTIDRRREKC